MNTRACIATDKQDYPLESINSFTISFGRDYRIYRIGTFTSHKKDFMFFIAFFGQKAFTVFRPLF